MPHVAKPLTVDVPPRVRTAMTSVIFARNDAKFGLPFVDDQLIGTDSKHRRFANYATGEHIWSPEPNRRGFGASQNHWVRLTLYRTEKGDS